MNKNSPDSHAGYTIDAEKPTPLTSAVNTGETDKPTGRPTTDPPEGGIIRSIAKLTAASTLAGAIMTSTGKEGPCDPEGGQLTPNPIDILGPDSEFIYHGASADKEACTFNIDSSKGTELVRGIQLIDGETEKICYFSRPWSPGAAIKLAGELEANSNNPGKIKLKDGIIEVQIGVETYDTTIDQDIPKEIIVEGEASLAITTEGRVSVTILPQEEGRDKNNILVMIIAENGKSTIQQEGREITLEECEKIKIPLNIEEVNLGCHMAQAEPCKENSQSNSLPMTLLAGGILLFLRRRKRKQTN